MGPKYSRIDALVLSAFVILITWHPYYCHQKINLFELGLYLPGIDGILKGQVPYRDFFYLRGPFELYVPAALMRFFGEHVAVLSAYFYAGTVIALIVCVWIARELFSSRLFFYMLVPVLVARTFPRVVFTYWGGLRYAWGLLALLCVIRFLRGRAMGWLIAAGVLTAIAGLTSIEIGVCAFVAVAAVLLWDSRRWQYLRAYALAIAAVAGPYFIYLACNGALADYVNAQWVVATQIAKIFPQTEPVPSGLFQVLHAFLVPTDKNFRQMTPAYCYVFFAAYLFWRRRRGQLDWTDRAAAVVAVYGFMVYVTGFRNLWANVFEMSLQPQKIVLFYLLSRCVGHVSARGHSKKLVYALIAGLVVSSLGYSIDRFNKRFLFFRKDPLKGQAAQRMDLPRLKGMTLPRQQAEDIYRLKNFIDAHTAPGEAVWMYPELGAMHFILARPWVGKFPTATLSWIDDGWFNAHMDALQRSAPRYAIVDKQPPEYFERSYFRVAANKMKFERQMAYIKQHYSLIDSTPTYNIYIRHH